MTLPLPFRRLLPIAFALASLFFALSPSPAKAYLPPPSDSNEAGGTHFRITTSNGPVHVWHPANFDPSTARTIIHVHGYHMYDDVKPGVAIDSPPTYKIDYKEHVDYVWDAHNLADKFAASGINALFIVPDAWQNNNQGPMWTSLQSLLDTVKTKTGVTPPGQVFAFAHSGGIFTIRNWYDHPKLTGLVMLDSLYDSLSALNAWIAKEGHGIAVVAAGSGATQTGNFVTAYKDKPGTVYITEFPPNLSEEQKSAKVLIVDGRKSVAKTVLDHMALVEGDTVMRVMLQRFGTSTAPAVAGTGSSGGDVVAGEGGQSGSLTTLGEATIKLRSPILQIPIPGVNLSDAYLSGGDVIAPYLAQYITGVYAFLISIVGIIAAVVLIHAGFLYMTAGGSADRVGKAREKIRNALIGMALAFGSYTILYAINPALIGFKAFGLINVQSVLYNVDRTNAMNEDGAIAATEEQATTPPPGAGSGAGFPSMPSSGHPDVVCGKGGKPRPCSDFCKMPRDKTIVDDDTGKTVKISSEWPTHSNGMANPALVVKITGLKGVTSSQRTDPLTYTLLKRAGEIASDTAELAKIGVSGGPYVINVTSGYRPLWKQIDLACESGGVGDNIGSTLATPGSSMHGAGFALDIALVKDGTVVSRSGNSQAQQYPKWRDGAIKLAKIMIAAGFRRLNNEIWHFEPASAPSLNCRCYKVSECTFPAAASSPFYQQVQAKEAEIAAAKAEGDKAKQAAAESALKAMLNVKNPASPIGCGKKSNYANE